MAFTAKQQRFIDAYDGDIRRTAEKAGVSYAYGRQLMCLPKHAHVQAAIANREATESNRAILTRQERQEFWSRMARTAKRDADKLKASELLGKSEADFTERIEQGGSVTVKIVKYGEET